MAGKREARGFDDEEGEERHRNPFLPTTSNKIISGSKIQFRNKVSVGRWDEEMGMTEIVEKKGSIWVSTGIIRNGKLYCHVEETLFLAEIGALAVLYNGHALGFRDLFGEIASGSAKCSWKAFEAYKHLKLLGYIVQRHGIHWSGKNEETCHSPKPSSGSKEDSSLEVEEELSTLLKELQISELKPMFDVYLPNSKFRKSSPGDPSFLLCILSENPPSRVALERLERLYAGVALRFCYVDHGRVSFFTFDKVSLPTLP